MTTRRRAASQEPTQEQAQEGKSVTAAKAQAAKSKILVTTVHRYPLACVEQGVRITPGVAVEVENTGWIARQLKAGTIREM